MFLNSYSSCSNLFLFLFFFAVNPGGWAPPSVVRTIAKREITKFLKKFSSCCYSKYSNSPLTL